MKVSFGLLAVTWCSACLLAAATPSDLSSKFPFSFERVDGHPDDYVLRGLGYGFEIKAGETALTFLRSKAGFSLQTRFLESPAVGARSKRSIRFRSLPAIFSEAQRAIGARAL